MFMRHTTYKRFETQTKGLLQPHLPTWMVVIAYSVFCGQNYTDKVFKDTNIVMGGLFVVVGNVTKTVNGTNFTELLKQENILYVIVYIYTLGEKLMKLIKIRFIWKFGLKLLTKASRFSLPWSSLHSSCGAWSGRICSTTEDLETITLFAWEAVLLSAARYWVVSACTKIVYEVNF